jgi:hypothetical protein
MHELERPGISPGRFPVFSTIESWDISRGPMATFLVCFNDNFDFPKSL